MASDTTKAVATLAVCGAVVGFGIVCGVGLAGMPVVVTGLKVVGGTLASGAAVGGIKRLAQSMSTSATALGRNDAVARLLADAARHCVREVAEERNWFDARKSAERFALERAARRLATQWKNVDLSSLGDACDDVELVAWFEAASDGASAIPSPLSLDLWRGLVTAACGTKLNTDLREEIATALHERFTHWVRERFKADFAGDTPAKGRAYAALQLALLGGLYDLLGQAYEPSKQAARMADHIKLDTEQIRDVLDRVREQVDRLADDPRLRGHFDDLARAVRTSGVAVLQAIRAVHDPLFYVPSKGSTEGAQRFVFRNERIALFGREGELVELNAWLDEDRPFSWDLWTGPAGAGKSRLALHLCKERERQGWRTGFYDWQPHASVRWDSWQPPRDTLIVFDYVHERAAEIGAVLRVLSNRSWPSGRRVRVLLLEREIARLPEEKADGGGQSGPIRARAELPTPAWLDELTGKGHNTDGGMEAARARLTEEYPERPIAGVEPQAIADIVVADAQLVGDEADTEMLVRRCELVALIDPRLRPLFAAMTAEAVREGTSDDGTPIARWDVQRLVDHFLKRERERWEKALTNAGVCDPAAQTRWQRLACLATMCEGLAGDALRQALTDGRDAGLPTLSDWGDGRVYRMLISGGGVAEAPRLEPDLIGEAFVLWHLRDDSLLRGALIELSWQCGMRSFVAHAAQEFPDDDCLIDLLQPRASSSLPALVQAHINRGLKAWRAGDRLGVSARGRKLALDRDQPPLLRAVGLRIWAQIELAEEDYRGFLKVAESISEHDPVDLETRSELASSLVNALAGEPGDEALADSLLSHLRSIATNPEHVDEELDALAQGLFNALNNASRNGLRAFRLLNELCSLGEGRSDRRAVRESVSRALCNGIAYADEEVRLVDGLLQRLKAFAGRHPGDIEVQVQYAHGLCNAGYCSGGDFERADRLLCDLRSLASEYEEERDLQLAVLLGFAKMFEYGVRFGVIRIYAIDWANGILGKCERDALTRDTCRWLIEAAWNASKFCNSCDPGLIQPAMLRLKSTHDRLFPDSASMKEATISGL